MPMSNAQLAFVVESDPATRLDRIEALVRAIRDLCWDADNGPDRHPSHRTGDCPVCDAYAALDAIEDAAPEVE